MRCIGRKKAVDTVAERDELLDLRGRHAVEVRDGKPLRVPDCGDLFEEYLPKRTGRCLMRVMRKRGSPAGSYGAANSQPNSAECASAQWRSARQMAFRRRPGVSALAARQPPA